MAGIKGELMWAETYVVAHDAFKRFSIDNIHLGRYVVDHLIEAELFQGREANLS
jgi:hypothetical protein